MCQPRSAKTAPLCGLISDFAQRVRALKRKVHDVHAWIAKDESKMYQRRATLEILGSSRTLHDNPRTTRLPFFTT
jgi:hypothetical protein